MQALRVARPERSEPAIEVLLELNPFKTGSSGSSTVTVTEKVVADQCQAQLDLEM